MTDDEFHSISSTGSKTENMLRTREMNYHNETRQYCLMTVTSKVLTLQ